MQVLGNPSLRMPVLLPDLSPIYSPMPVPSLRMPVLLPDLSPIYSPTTTSHILNYCFSTVPEKTRTYGSSMCGMCGSIVWRIQRRIPR